MRHWKAMVMVALALALVLALHLAGRHRHGTWQDGRTADALGIFGA